MCKCEEEKLRREKAKEKVEERKENLRSEGLSDMDSQAARSMTLDKDDGSFPFMSNLAKKYTQNWQTVYKSGKGGLILWGSPGTGKTYFATAIGNAIREQGVSVGRVTAANLVEALSGMYDGEKRTKVQMLNYCDLLILDDLGAERDTQYGREVIFSLVDDRYKRKKPLIVTTNLTMKQMQEPMTRKGEVDMGYKRIFDRVLGMGTPVQMSGESHRRQEGREGRDLMRGLR
jgi:DNA replication protein DnaC